MNRAEKAVAVAEIADQIKESEAIFAVDYRGITVTQVAEVRAQLRGVDATLRVVKNSLTERAADAVGAEYLKDLLSGPTALTFVRGDAAAAAKAISTFHREHAILAFKGGMMNGETLDVEQIQTIARLPAREVLYGQLVGVVASPITGLARSLGGLLGGLAIALGQLNEKKQSGEVEAGEAPAAAAPAAEPEAPDDEAAAEAAPEAEAEAEAAPDDTQETAPVADEPAAEAADDTPSDNENEADASA
ncbi:unannotated protein [freshwater metagenome]|uniref:Unannotated protein n=1 Tax=freshwater metagenome TaxID=449393 RepID=A0A6J7DML6_9ZZZZ|nr:50S ribosomal protein L10 [Actinomycetota bacterium]